MPNLLIYKDREDFHAQHETIALLKGSFDSTDFCDQNIESLKEKITQDKVKILIVLIKDKFSPALDAFLEKSRNHINLHDALIIVVHTKWTALDAQRCLLSGASYLLEEPLDFNFLSLIVANHLAGKEFDLNIGYQHFKSHLECQIDSFGRIGRLEKKSPGNLFVETSLEWIQGAVVDLHHLLALDLKEQHLKYRVLEKSSKGLYYRYAHQYHLEWEKTAALESSYLSWLNLHQKEFSIPKVKLLFVIGNQRAGSPVSFGTELYSSYVVYSGQLSDSLLERIDPQIVISESLPNLHKQTLEEWLSRSTSKKLFISQLDVLPTEKAEEEKLRSHLLKLIIPYTKENFLSVHNEFLYLSRKSEYSRFAFGTNAEIVALSKHHFLIHSPVGFAVGSTIQLFLPADSSPIFLRVLHTESTANDGKHVVHCSIFYLSETQRQAILKEKVWSHTQTQKSNNATNYIPVQKRVGFLERKNKWQYLIIAAVIILTLSLILLNRMGSKNSPASSSTEIKSTESKKSIDVFQESVRKAFGFSEENTTTNNK